jgi:hypothetical protein
MKASNQVMKPTTPTAAHSTHIYEVRPRRDKRGVDPISDALPFGRLWLRRTKRSQQCNRLRKVFSRSHDAVIRVYDEGGNVIETHEHAGEFREP